MQERDFCQSYSDMMKQHFTECFLQYLPPGEIQNLSAPGMIPLVRSQFTHNSSRRATRTVLRFLCSACGSPRTTPTSSPVSSRTLARFRSIPILCTCGGNADAGHSQTAQAHVCKYVRIRRTTKNTHKRGRWRWLWWGMLPR